MGNSPRGSSHSKRKDVKSLENKSPLMSGRLMGTRTLSSELSNIENPDEIEQFLKEFVNVSFEVPEDNNVIEARTEREVLDAVNELRMDEAVSIFTDKFFQKLYVTTKDETTYILRMKRANMNEISAFLSAERPVKYILGGFSFVKWCNMKSIELRNVIDLLVQIKLLTNEVDPFMTASDYLKKYAKGEPVLHLEEPDKEEHSEDAIVESGVALQREMILAGNFVLMFGEYLAEKLDQFGLSSVCKIVSENSYYEGISQTEEEDLCKIRFSYVGLEEFVEENKLEFLKKYQERAYLKSPLGRIALKFGNHESELMKELCLDDIEIKILNELFNNNIKAVLLAENYYEVVCKYKSFGSVISFIIAIMKDSFYTLFERKIDVKLECLVRE